MSDKKLFKKKHFSIKKKIAGFFKFIKKIPQSIIRPKHHYLSRLIVIAFFLGINIVLLPYFLQTNNVKLPEKVTHYLQNYLGDDRREFVESLLPLEPSLDPQVILLKLNFQRSQKTLPDFRHSDKLDLVAKALLLEIEKNNYEIEGVDLSESLRQALVDSGYAYAQVSHNTLIGPTFEDSVIKVWLDNPEDKHSLFEQNFSDVGLATKIVDGGREGTYGVVVQVLGEPQTNSAGNQTKVEIVATPITFPEISNQEVLDALNAYRSSHGVRQLSTHPNLCQYAEKRAQDLVEYGGLDGHEGFKSDFEDPENIPQAIRDYPGKSIAENLAYQYCKNMTTGESFIAETGTALIEWCFDSSTAGHREAQLSSDFRNACVSSANNMFVIIFGD